MVLTARLTELIEFVSWEITGTTAFDNGGKWVVYKSVYASILNQRGNTNFSAPGNVYFDGISFYMRWIDIVKKGLTIKYKDQYYEISDCTTVQRNQALVINCSAVQ